MPVDPTKPADHSSLSAERRGQITMLNAWITATRQGTVITYVDKKDTRRLVWDSWIRARGGQLVRHEGGDWSP